MIDVAQSSPQSTIRSVISAEAATGNVRAWKFVRRSANKNSFQEKIKEIIAVAASPGPARGSTMRTVKIKKRGEDNVEVWKLLLANVRTPRVNYGDLRALIAAVDLG